MRCEVSVGAVVVAIPSGTMTVACAGATYWRWRRLIWKLDDLDDVLGMLCGIGHLHVVEAIVVFDMLVVEPRAVTGLPGCSADHAELGSTSTCHVVAALLQFHYSLAIIASLPAFFFGHLHQTIRLLILWTLALGVEPFVAKYAYFS